MFKKARFVLNLLQNYKKNKLLSMVDCLFFEKKLNSFCAFT